VSNILLSRKTVRTVDLFLCDNRGWGRIAIIVAINVVVAVAPEKPAHGLPAFIVSSDESE